MPEHLKRKKIDTYWNSTYSFFFFFFFLFVFSFFFALLWKLSIRDSWLIYFTPSPPSPNNFSSDLRDLQKWPLATSPIRNSVSIRKTFNHEYCVHSFARNWQLPFLNQQNREIGPRKYFMINLHERMLPAWRGSTPHPDHQSGAHPTEPPGLALEMYTSAVKLNRF